MTLKNKFKRDIHTLLGAVNKEFFLDVSHPKLFKKVKRYYNNKENIEFTGNHYEDYDIMMEVILEDLS
tara:strand:+ start:672 stop:875 length:204 start_codon:yes stop_codon:yes gene_type:complete